MLRGSMIIIIDKGFVRGPIIETLRTLMIKTNVYTIVAIKYLKLKYNY